MVKTEISKGVFEDLIRGTAKYITKRKSKPARMLFTSIVISNDSITFFSKKKKLATLILETHHDFSKGDVVTIEFNGDMGITIE